MAHAQEQDRAPVGAGGWTLRLNDEKPCDFTDTHEVSGMSSRRRVVIALAATAVLALVIAFGLGTTVGIWVGGLTLGLWLSAGYSTRLQGGELVLRRYGLKKVVPFREVGEAQIYRYRNAVSLRLRKRDGTRVGDVSARALRQHPETAAHLRHWLDRPDVAWGPGTWQLLAPPSWPAPVSASTGGDGSAESTEQNGPAAPLDDPQPAGDRPRGRFIAARPQSKWLRGVAWFSVAVFVFGALFLLVLVPVQWSDYVLSQDIQHGGQAVATLQYEWVTSSSGQSGTSYTTHFDVTFSTRTGVPVTTEVNASGSYNQYPPGQLIAVRYDPAHPQSAELPGHPNHTLSGTLLITTVTAFTWVGLALMIRRFVRVRRIKRAARHGSSLTPAG